MVELFTRLKLFALKMESEILRTLTNLNEEEEDTFKSHKFIRIDSLTKGSSFVIEGFAETECEYGPRVAMFFAKYYIYLPSRLSHKLINSIEICKLDSFCKFNVLKCKYNGFDNYTKQADFVFSKHETDGKTK